MLNKIKTTIIILLLFFPVISFSVELPDNSIYHMDIHMLDKFGADVILKDLSGKIHIFSMIYTHCKTICPIIISNMKLLEKSIPIQYLSHINFLLISLDPDRDTLASLNNFFLEKNLNESHWSIYKVNNEDVLKIALATGIKYKKDKNNEYIHSNLIVIIDKNGVVRFHQQGLDKNFEELIKIIISLI